MRAIILAAGAGRRLGLDGPKCLIDVAGTTILRRQLAAFRAAGVEQFVIVVGFRQEQVREHVAGSPGQFTFIENPRYLETNTIASLYLARDHFAGGFFYANADVVFDRRLPERLRAATQPHVLAMKRVNCGAEEVKLVLDGERVVRIGKRLDPAACAGEFLGVARFGPALAEPLADALRDLVEREEMVTEYFERALDRLGDRHELHATDVSDLPCGEIDFLEDLAIVRRDVGPRLEADTI